MTAHQRYYNKEIVKPMTFWYSYTPEPSGDKRTSLSNAVCYKDSNILSNLIAKIEFRSDKCPKPFVK